MLIWLLILLIVVFAVTGGLAINTWLWLLLIIALIVIAFGPARSRW